MKGIPLASFWQLDWDSGMDILLPLSLLTLLLQKSEDPLWMIIVLVVWLGIKIVLRATSEHAYWYLLGVLVIFSATLFRPVSMSSPTDLLLVFLAFAVGVGRSHEQWRKSFWILASIGLVAIFVVKVLNGSQGLNFLSMDSLDWLLPDYRIRLGEITINRSGYILGAVSLIGYGLCRYLPGCSRWLALLFASSAYVLAFLTGSRAAALLPIVSILCSELAWKYRGFVRDKVTNISLTIVAIGLAFNLLIYLPISPFAYKGVAESERADVAQCFFSKATKSWPNFFVGKNLDRTSRFCERTVVSFHRGRRRSVPHAHNAFLQTFADYGIFSVSILLIAFTLSIRNALKAIAAGEGLFGTLAFSLVLFLLFSALVESTLLKTSLQQILTGYLLAISWPKLLPSE